jgi:hypothetical protein
MNRSILIVFLFFSLLTGVFSQSPCIIDAPSIACVAERLSIQFESDVVFDNVKIDAYTVINGTQELAIKENVTDNSADIIFISGGDSEIVVRFFDGNTLLAICNWNVFVFDEDPIPALGSLSNFVGDQVTCELLDLEFEMFISCPECPFFWTLNDEVIEIEQSTTISGPLQLINAHLEVEGIGAYTFCQQILKPDSTCYIKDCISIDIVELDIQPSFSLDEDFDIFCKGATLQFINETIIDEDVIYIWEVTYDSLQWRLIGEKLEFDFLYAGEYSVSLQYILANDNNCVSDKSTMSIEISDAPIIPITCSTNSCKDSVFTYQVPIDCDDFNWIIDESLGSILSTDESGITIKWKPVDKYTETKISLFLSSCSENACDETFREIFLFPASLTIEGAKGVCDRGSEWYETDLIPNAIYTWEVEMIDSIAGIPPSVLKIEDNRARIAYNSYIGTSNIKVHVNIPSKDCEIDGELITTSVLVLTNDNLCIGDLFKASVIPNLDEDVTWTLSNSEHDYLNQQTISGQEDFFAFDFNFSGIYTLDMQIPDLEFECGEEILLNVLDRPSVSLVGPEFICPGDSVTYTLEGLGGNDNVTWTVFQNNISTEYVDNEITILWEEGGAPYIIKVQRTTEVSPGQFCDSEIFTFDIFDIKDQGFEVSGPEIVCYDAQGIYQLENPDGEFIWNIDPPFMGTIVEGDSTATVTVQWHYAPDVPFATLSTQKEVCDSIYYTDVDVYFEPFVPELLGPDSICVGQRGRVELLGLETYQTIEYYLNDILVSDDRLFYRYLFEDTGYVEVKVVVVNPNGCPGESTATKMVYVLPRLNFSFSTDLPITQCPKENFQDVVVEPDYINPEAYYVWSLDGTVIKEGLGETNLYSFIVTKEMIDAGVAALFLTIDAPGLCQRSRNLPLIYNCDLEMCACIDNIVGNVDYLTPLKCNLASFGGSLDFSTIIDPYWRIAMNDTIIIIPINGPEDLIQDSFYFDENRLIAQVAILGTCEGVILLNGVVIDSTLCDILVTAKSEKLYSPIFVEEYICNEDLTYNIIFTERSLEDASPPYSSTVFWRINSIAYEGVSIVVENVPGGSDLDISITQCSLDGTYCCTKKYETTARKEFSPNIILPNGSCENNLWEFTLDVSPNSIVSALWDFGDGSGSTLPSTSKGFLDTLSHDISVVVTDDLGCVALAETTVKSFPNLIDGKIIFEDDPCAPMATLTYIENGETTIGIYDWSVFNSPDSSSIQVSTSGDFTVTVTDIHGCTDEESVSNIMVNESFVGGLRFKSENCGAAVASILTNDGYSYIWYVDGTQISTASNIQLVNPGEFEIKVISTSLTTNEICDSIVETITIFPLPDRPVIGEEKIFCDPFIIELSVLNYPTAAWTVDNTLKVDEPSIFVSQNGIYVATIEDENGCINKSTRKINEVEIPFDQLLDECIQACREDLDSLALTIPAIGWNATSWTWVTVDSLGVEYEVDVSSGSITPLTITSDMYDYIQLQIIRDDCVLRSERIPLDIELCDQPEPPVEIDCEPIDSDHASCGQSIYKCLVSEANGGPKLYFEGSVILPMGAVLCVEDSLTVSLNNGEITITDLLFEELDGKIMAFYSANLLISDPIDYEQNGTVIKFDFCDEEGELAYCYEYALPYRSCGKDFTCLIDYMGVESGANQTVKVNYCLNLSEVNQEDCTLTEYEVKAILSGNESSKTIYTHTLNGSFDNLQCIEIPISLEDFFGGEFNCIELIIDGNCPGISCSDYKCGIFGNSYLLGIDNNNTPLEKASDEELIQVENTIEHHQSTFKIYPNPSSGLMTFNFEVENESRSMVTGKKDCLISIKNSIGQTIKTIPIRNKKSISEDLGNQQAGLYIASLVIDGKIIESKRFLLIR